MSSAILSADDLNDFISPGVACIKPVETLPAQPDYNPYEVTTEDKVAATNPAPASISLTDCLACSGCVTSAEAVLVSLQSHTEVLDTLEKSANIDIARLLNADRSYEVPKNGRIFVASISPQVRASIAATYGISRRQAGNLITRLLSGPDGLGEAGASFQYVLDTNAMRSVCLNLAAEEVAQSVADTTQKRPVITSACPGWICYAEKTHPHILPHLSRLKSPQALTGTLVKSVLSKKLGVSPAQIWHLAVMPCFDKKLEASREELTNKWWQDTDPSSTTQETVRDVDCVITSRELLSLASTRDITLHALPTTPLRRRLPFPDPLINQFLRRQHSLQNTDYNTSGGYLNHILRATQSQNPNSTIQTHRGRNNDVCEYTLISSTNTPIMKCARYYGFRNIQNLVRKLKPQKSNMPGVANRRKIGSGGNSGGEYAYVEVMACPGGCTNGGGQINLEDAMSIIPVTRGEQVDEGVDVSSSTSQKEWLARVDEAYFSAEQDDSDIDTDTEMTGQAEANGTNAMHFSDLPIESCKSGTNGNHNEIHMNGECDSDGISIEQLLNRWAEITAIPIEKLVYTSYRAVESDVGKPKVKDMGANIAKIAGLEGGGW